MNSSPTIGALVEALSEAQKEMKNPAFDSTNPHFNSKYASLSAVRECVIPVLQKHGLMLTQFPKCAPGCAGVVNRLFHVATNEWMEEECLLPFDKNSPHQAGSAITYARRYSLQCIGGVISEEDDDGNAASITSKKEERKPDAAALKALTEAAGKGKDAFYKAWDATPQDKRATIPQSVLADLKAKCDEAVKGATH